jgi:hypothetical protein
LEKVKPSTALTEDASMPFDKLKALSSIEGLRFDPFDFVQGQL